MGRRRKPSMGPKRPEASSSVILRALVQAGLGDQAWRLSIRALWAEAVGPNIAKRTGVASFNRGTLVVRAASATWQQELMYLRVAIVEKLNARLGARRIRELKVIGGHIAADEPEIVRRAPHAPPPREGEGDVGQSIACPEVRAAFARIMRRGRARLTDVRTPGS